jgi:hypothetical protein
VALALIFTPGWLDGLHQTRGGTAWTLGRTPADVATIRARAEQVARDYFGHRFPAIPL